MFTVLAVLGQLLAVPLLFFLFPSKGGGREQGTAFPTSLSRAVGIPRGGSTLRRTAVAHLALPTRGALTPEDWQEFLRQARENAAQGVASARESFDRLKRDVDGAMAAAATALATPVLRAHGELEGRLRALRGANVDLGTGDDTTAMSRYKTQLADLETRASDVLVRPGWTEVARRDGIVVWKQYLPQGEYGSQYPCVKAQGLVKAPPEEVRDLLVESERIREYNSYSVGRTDVAKLDPRTKIVWNKAQPPLSSKLHDFCTLMHVRPLDDGSGGFVMLTRATDHPKAPVLKNHIRSEIVLGVTVLRPAPGGATEVTTVNHIVSNGVPAILADKVSAKNAADFIVNVDRSFDKARKAAKVAAAAAAAAAASSS